MLTFLLATVALSPPAVDCRFDPVVMQFAGSPLEQATCLLRHVKPGGSADEKRDLPPMLALLIGRPVSINLLKLAAELRHDRIPLPVSTPVSETLDHHRALYFVIHDTSSPWIMSRPFPRHFNSQPQFNDVAQFLGKDAVAHLFNDREGKVTIGHDLEVGWRATKLERAVGEAVRGRFIHVENVQPRREDPNGPRQNDRIAPIPGFSVRQYRTLALLYVLASARAGNWLVPAFHANIDRGIPQGHDDPQNFDLAIFDREVERFVKRLL
ncbi:MAG TPA: hypothetical protein VGU01_10785 [Sphingomicrobium sp.]|nr:hypothetical protein [Sphingomicrobium sp.]